MIKIIKLGEVNPGFPTHFSCVTSGIFHGLSDPLFPYL